MLLGRVKNPCKVHAKCSSDALTLCQVDPQSKVTTKSNLMRHPHWNNDAKLKGADQKYPHGKERAYSKNKNWRPKSTPLKCQTNMLVVILVASVPFNTSPVSVLKANPCSGETKVADHLQDHRHRQSGLPTLTWVFKDVTNEFLLSTSWQAVETILTGRPTNGLRVMGWKEELSVNSLFA